MKSVFKIWVQNQTLGLGMMATSVLKALAKMLSSMAAAKRLVESDTVPAQALWKAENAKAGNSAALTFENLKAVGSGASQSIAIWTRANESTGNEKSLKGLVHFLYNADIKNPAISISSFGSANSGTVSAPTSVFAKELMMWSLPRPSKQTLPLSERSRQALQPRLKLKFPFPDTVLLVQISSIPMGRGKFIAFKPCRSRFDI
ncbi:hypothetical protein SADUNF_Sadunf09G0012600 [Salix dunnii]|uniref:Uncharacterized protein n=1 Tax=Salix dunnii TaxID=1413687 RepID=A0A835JTH9_9ROSI|nr:hypothetical protein SADUNF_Sadunf09G0012600 [Salix dunnii]